MIDVKNEPGSVIEVCSGYPVRQHFDKKVGRWYVWLPKYSGLRELFGGRDRMLRSHYVWCRANEVYAIPFGYVIHHRDHDRCNDILSNLKLMSESEHNAYHASPEGRKGFRRGWTAGTKHSPETIQRFREMAGVRGNNGVWEGPKKTHFESTKELMSKKASGKKNAAYRHDLDDEAIRLCYAETGSIGLVARIFGCSAQAVRNRITERPAYVDWKTLTDSQIIEELEKRGRNVHQTALAIAAPLSSLWRRIKRIEEQRNVG